LSCRPRYVVARSVMRLLRRRGVLARSRHDLVEVPFLPDRRFRARHKRVRLLWIRAAQHAVAQLALSVVAERHTRALGVEDERVLAPLSELGIVAQQRPVTR